MTDSTLVALVTGIGAIFGGGGVYAWFKLGPERGQITVSAAQGAVIVHSSVLHDVKQAYDQLAQELAEVKMEAIAKEDEYDNCQREIRKLEASVQFLQRDLDRHGRMSELARRKTHAALNVIGSYELLVDNLLAELRDHDITITPDMRTHGIRQRFQDEMNKLEELESTTTEQALRLEPPVGPEA